MTPIVTTLDDDSAEKHQGGTPRRPDQQESAFLEAQRTVLSDLTAEWKLNIPPEAFASLSIVKQGRGRLGEGDLMVLYDEGPLSSFCMYAGLLGRPFWVRHYPLIAERRRRHPMVFRGFIGEANGSKPSHLQSMRLYPIAGQSKQGALRRDWPPNTVQRRQIVMWPPFHELCTEDESVTPRRLREIAIGQRWVLAGVEMMALMMWDPDGAGRLPDLPATIYLGALEVNGPENQSMMPYLRLELPDNDGPLELRVGLQKLDEPVFDNCMMPRIASVRA
ncbi:MAG TPA: hypothetical protein VLI05_01180 [Candidatus Saccharimonadia bacterium]|nr:hypothetical protein [Candidatus Saccharimonadia bacterium]